MGKYSELKEGLAQFRNVANDNARDLKVIDADRKTRDELIEMLGKRKHLIDQNLLHLVIEMTKASKKNNTNDYNSDLVHSTSSFSINIFNNIFSIDDLYSNVDIYSKLCRINTMITPNIKQVVNGKVKLASLFELMRDYDNELVQKGPCNFNYDSFLKLAYDHTDIFNLDVVCLLDILFNTLKTNKASGIDSKNMELYIRGIFCDLCTNLAQYTVDYLEIEFDFDKIIRGMLVFVKGEEAKIVKSIDKYIIKFSADQLLSAFTDEELKEFGHIIKAVFHDQTLSEKFINMIREDSDALRKTNASKPKQQTVELPVVNFDNLDMSRFSFEEQSIINTVRAIVTDNKVGTKSYSDVPLTSEARLEVYSNESLKNILSDVSYLLRHIYDDKDNVIDIFKVIIKKYVEFVKKEHVKVLEEINQLSKELINRISRGYSDNNYEVSTDNLSRLAIIQEEVCDGYLPMAQSIINDDFNEYDEEVASHIVRYKEMLSLIIRGLHIDGINLKTSNLVFNLQDLELSDVDFKESYKDAVANLEYRKLYDMRMSSSKVDLYPITYDNGDLVTYIRRVTGRRPHFIPRIYSSDNKNKVVVIEFKPSPIVRSHLEKKYGVLDEGNYYSVYRMISDSEIRRNGYDILSVELVQSFNTIEGLASLLTNDNPTEEQLNKIDSIIEEKMRMKEKLRFDLTGTQK